MQWSHSLVESTASSPLIEKALSRLEKPRQIRNSSLFDKVYRIQFDEDDVLAKPYRDLRLDAVVAPGGERLTDPGREHDELTARLYLILGLSPAGGWWTSPASVSLEYRSFLNLIRWRDGVGIRRFSDLNDIWFRDFIERLEAGRELFPLKQRLDTIMLELEAGREVPTYFQGAERIDWTAIAHELGLHSAKRLPAFVSQRILGHVRIRRPDISIRADRDRGENRLEQRYSVAHVSQLLAPWERLQELARVMQHDPFGFAPFNAKRNRWAVASSIGKHGDKTKDIPPEVVLKLLDGALRWVMVYGLQVRQWVDAVRNEGKVYGDTSDPVALPGEDGASALLREALSRAPAPEGPGAPTDVLPVYATHLASGPLFRVKGLDLRKTAFGVLAGACMVVIGTFTARRHEELASLKAGCVSERDGIRRLRCWLLKGFRAFHEIPVPRSVEVAVETLEWLSADARAASGNSWLLRFRELMPGGKVFSPKLVTIIDLLAEQIGPLEDMKGCLWAPRPHQLRRAFLVTYFWRYRFPSLTAASDFLGHFDPTVTSGYVEAVIAGRLLRILDVRDASSEEIEALRAVDAHDSDLRAMVDEVAHEFLASIMRGVMLGTEVIGGIGGRQLKLDLGALIGRLKGAVTVSGNPSDEHVDLDAVLADFVAARFVRPHPDGHSYCKCTPSRTDLAAAACLRKRAELGLPMEGIASPDWGQADAVTCGGCPHGVKLRENVAVVRELEGRLLKEARLGSAASQRERAAAMAATLAEQRASWFESEEVPWNG